MTERRKKAPKIAWRDLGKPGSDAPPAETPADDAKAEATPVPAPRAAKAKKAAKPSVSAASVAALSAEQGPERAAATEVAAEASSPIALAARLDEAYAALVADTAREEQAAANDASPGTTGEAAPVITPDVAPTPIAPAAIAPAPLAVTRIAAAGAPPEDNVAPAPAERVTTRAHVASPAPASVPRTAPAPAIAAALPQPAAPASTPAATPEAEVQRILARLATYVPVPRAAIVASDTEQDVALPAVPRGPMPVEEDVAPLVTLSGLREAARTRRGRVELLLFRAGGELFALPLGAVEEAIESPAIHSLPEMPTAMLGVFNLRERLVPAYSPGASLGVALAEPAGAALVVRSGERRLALAADDVEDVMELDLSTLRDPPVVEDTDGILLGVARFSRDLVGILDADALISACLGGRNVENP